MMRSVSPLAHPARSWMRVLRSGQSLRISLRQQQRALRVRGWFWRVLRARAHRHARRMGHKKPCSVCRRWFEPAARGRHCQRTCGRPECRVEQRRRTQQRYRRRNPDYWSERRLRAQARRMEASGKPPRPATVVCARLPWDWAQDAFRIQGAVFVALFVRLLIRVEQDALRVQHLEFAGRLSALRMGAGQDATDEAPGVQHHPP
jgi:hypothetical protein